MNGSATDYDSPAPESEEVAIVPVDALAIPTLEDSEGDGVLNDSEEIRGWDISV